MPVAAMALGATGSWPLRNSGSEMRPTCQICAKMCPPLIVNGLGDGLPGFDLLLRPEAGDVGVAYAEWIDGDAFGDDEAGSGSLGVVVDHDGRGDVVGRAAQAGERSHEDAVGEVEIADLDGVEEGRVVCHGVRLDDRQTAADSARGWRRRGSV